MKMPLSETEQENLRTRGVLGYNEIAYRENNVIFAEEPITGNKRAINTTHFIKEGSNLLLG